MSLQSSHKSSKDNSEKSSMHVFSSQTSNRWTILWKTVSSRWQSLMVDKDLMERILYELLDLEFFLLSKLRD